MFDVRCCFVGLCPGSARPQSNRRASREAGIAQPADAVERTVRKRPSPSVDAVLAIRFDLAWAHTVSALRVASTKGAIADSENGATLLTLTSHSTYRSEAGSDSGSQKAKTAPPDRSRLARPRTARVVPRRLRHRRLSGAQFGQSNVAEGSAAPVSTIGCRRSVPNFLRSSVGTRERPLWPWPTFSAAWAKASSEVDRSFEQKTMTDSNGSIG